MTKKEFKEKIEAQNEGMCKRHDCQMKIIKWTTIISGVFAACALFGLIASTVKSDELNITMCEAAISVAAGTIFGLQVGRQKLKQSYKEHKQQLDEIKNAVDEIETYDDEIDFF